MRGFKRVLAASGVALAAFSLTGAGNATAGVAKAEVLCATDSDGHTWAEAICEYGEYRVVVDYCRVTCSTERGPWTRQPYVSRIDGFPSGGSIVVKQPEVR
ncbi:hypothetical protein KIPE111705_07545 [Kibdelosporangium persicum]|uniref:Secreted protein n=1 Tax=Kibdelosporangium persicum TaxID=2698649 RepID=A0ABX2F1R2_9PSEU|nr:hypothetical protein [Kibdelosporangium persicum]NRN65274.1 hypothetical protein [Kibdelosporangium persicum]